MSRAKISEKFHNIAKDSQQRFNPLAGGMVSKVHGPENCRNGYLPFEQDYLLLSQWRSGILLLVTQTTVRDEAA